MQHLVDVKHCLPACDYAKRLETERNHYEQCLNVHDLPPIFGYWSERYLRPLLSAFGFNSPDAMFAKYLEERCLFQDNGVCRFVSIGSGNCSLEVELAARLLSRGHSRFSIECLDLNSAMLERGATAARLAGVSDRLIFTQGDLNHWHPTCEYDAVMANQSLHHVMGLEVLFAGVNAALKPTGSFIISDMIGRNGHQRWPEALQLVHEFWRKLLPSHRYNHSLRRYEEMYENWDCSLEGFEGIRSQDILPLLLDRFHFRLFIGFGNAIDPFVDRAFGPNFDVSSEWDRDFIDQVQRRDQAALLSGTLKPTHMLAVVGKNPDVQRRCYASLNPEVSVRPSGVEHVYSVPMDPYDWKEWPQHLHQEIQSMSRILSSCEEKISEMESELEERTAWAVRLDEELKASASLVLELQREIRGYTRNPVRYAAHMSAGLWKRVKRLVTAMPFGRAEISIVDSR